MPACTDVFRARILIVDDQDSNVRLLDYTLRRAGYLSVASTTDPVEVCALHRQNRYDLILLDLQMPRMNGFDVMEALDDIETEVLVDVLVLSADPAQMARALEAGATGFLSKPLLLVDVLQRIRLMLEERVAREIEETIAMKAAIPANDPVLVVSYSAASIVVSTTKL